MGRETSVEARFRERIRREREERKLSQAELAEMLGGKGIKGIYPTTIAKIESGERAVRIDEAAALADLFEVSVDALMGRSPDSQTSELAFELRNLRDTTRRFYLQVHEAHDVISGLIGDLPWDFDGYDRLERWGNIALNGLQETSLFLLGLDAASADLLEREQGKGEPSEESLHKLEATERIIKKRKMVDE